MRGMGRGKSGKMSRGKRKISNGIKDEKGRGLRKWVVTWHAGIFEIGRTMKERRDRNFAQIRGLPIFPRIVLSAFFDTGNLLIPTIHQRVP